MNSHFHTNTGLVELTTDLPTMNGFIAHWLEHLPLHRGINAIPTAYVAMYNHKDYLISHVHSSLQFISEFIS